MPVASAPAGSATTGRVSANRRTTTPPARLAWSRCRARTCTLPANSRANSAHRCPPSTTWSTTHYRSWEAMVLRADPQALPDGGMTTGKLCIGVDVGGTFTDVVLSDGSRVWRAKAASTTGALGRGVIAACRLVAQRAGLDIEVMLSRVERFGLGTTAVTNDIASRTGHKVGLVTTRGFEDLVPIARVRRVPRDGWLVPPDSLIERDWIV